MADAHVANKVAHVPRAEHITHQPLVLVHVKPVAIGRHDACGILATVLQDGQSVIEQLIDRAFRYDANNPAHESIHPLGWC